MFTKENPYLMTLLIFFHSTNIQNNTFCFGIGTYTIFTHYRQVYKQYSYYYLLVYLLFFVLIKHIVGILLALVTNFGK